MRMTFGLALAFAVGALTTSAARAHDHEGPHKGIVVEWGEEEYHPEIVVDAKTGTVTVYVYGNDDDLKKAKLKPIDAKTLTLALKTNPAITVKLEATPEKDDPKDKATKFVGKNDVFKTEMKWAGTLSGKVGTKPYTGDFKQK
jgi:hypothetical protein